MKTTRILVVEDEALIASDLEMRLQELGYEVVGAVDSGEEALRAAVVLKPDIVFMDIRLKGRMDGIDAAEALTTRHQIPTVFVTSHADAHTLARASQAEPLGYVIKPFEDKELRATIETAVHRHRAEQRHRRMERWLATTLASIGDAVLATDVEGRITFLNKVAEQLTGWSMQDAVGLGAAEVFRVQLGLSEGKLPDLVSEALARQSIISCGHDAFLINRSGNVVPIDDSVAPIWGDDNEITGVVAVFKDRTGSVELEEERRRVEDKLRDTQKLESLGVLAGGIAHDFNNLLTGVLGNASLIEMELPEGSPILDYVQEIETAAMRAADLCKQMLAYAGKGRFAIKRIDLSVFVRDCEQLLQVSLSKRVVLKTNLGEGLPGIAVDSSQMRQVLLNLVVNASESMAESGGVVTIVTGVMRTDRAYLDKTHLAPDLPEGDYVFLEVSDTGCGMDKQTIDRIFDPFFTTKFMGRGLGLAAVLGIVRGHRGALKVYSEVNKGTTFKLMLPCAENPVEQFASPSPISPGWQTRGRALVVDDEETVRTIAARMLEAVGLTVLLARDGAECLEKFSGCNGNIDVVLLDLTMPRMDGVEAFRELRRVRPDVRVLLMSGFSEQEAVSQFIGRGLAGFLQKPFTRTQLLTKLQAVMMDQPA